MSPAIIYSSAAVFLFSAISLVVSSGYSGGAVLLSLAGIGLLFRRASWPKLERRDWIILLLFLVYFLTWAGEVWLDGQSSSRLDKPSRIVLAALALFWLLKYPPRASAFWGGIAAGAIMVGLWAGWQKLFEGVDRAGGFTHMIQFGNISMLLGMLSLTGLGWAMTQKRKVLWFIVLLAGMLGGMGGSLFSGSRGGWIGIPFVLLVLAHAYADLVGRRRIAIVAVLVVLLGTVFYFHPATGVQSRVQAAVSDVDRFFNEGVVNTSVGARFEMWRSGAFAFKESPIWGMGTNGFRVFRDTLIDAGKVDPLLADYGHLHNEYIDTAAKRGLIGLLALLALYLVPLKMFTRMLGERQANRQPYAAAGAVLCVSYMDYGLSQTFLSHNSGVMVFFFMMAIIWSLVRSSETGTAQTQPRSR